MEIADILLPERIAWSAHVASKKRVLELLSEMIAKSHRGLIPTEVFDSFVARERLGSTGLGGGVALPHGRLKSVDRTIGAFIRLGEGIDFDAVDHQPVDLLFALVVPEEATEEHLQLLAKLAEMFRDEGFCQALRQAQSTEQLQDLLERWSIDKAKYAVSAHS